MPTDALTTDTVLDLMKDVAAEVISPRFRSLASEQVHEKGPGDLVTIADHESERILTEHLQGAYPGALIVGEEATAADPELLKRMRTADHVWLVDPVDGTRNFVHGSPDHAVMVAEVRHGQTVRGWIWQPEHERSMVAELGAGVQENGESLRRAAAPERVENIGGAASHWAHRVLTRHPGRTNATPQDGALAPLAHTRRTAWCCGVDYPMLAAGDLDFLVFGPPKPWDHAPGALMITELGGEVRLLDGAPYTVAAHELSLIAASSQFVWDEVYSRLSLERDW